MTNAKRFKLHDVLGAECCHPSCYAPSTDIIATQVPLCELHVYQVYKAVNRHLNVVSAKDHEYQLLPMEATPVLGPCPVCGQTGYLTKSPTDDISCGNASCLYSARADTFLKTRRNLLINQAEGLEVVYYMRFRDRVKIGTSQNLRSRWRRLGTVAEDLLGYEHGGYALEQRRHRQFHTIRTRGEWFSLDPRLRHHINAVTALPT